MDDRVFGNVQVQRGRRKWKKAFLRCHKGKLSYFETMSSEKCLGVIQLNPEFYELEEGAEIKKGEKQTSIFKLKERHTGKAISFQCVTEKEKEDFMKGIRIEMGLEKENKVDINDEYQAALKAGGMSSLTVSPRIELEQTEQDVGVSSIVGHFVAYAQRNVVNMVNGVLRGEIPTAKRNDDGEDLGIRIKFLNLGKDDANAYKGVLNDVNAARYLLQQRRYRTTRIPLFAVLDYLGFRLIASAGPQPAQGNLEYGQIRGSKAPPKRRETTRLVDELAESFNLEEGEDYPFLIYKDDGNPKALYTADLGNLLVQDGPEAPEYAKLRLETTVDWERPISLKNMKSDGKGREQVLEIRRAVRDEVIPQTIQHLESIEVIPVDSPTLTRYIHGCGIKIYQLGFLAKGATLPHIIQLFELEMVARACKSILNASLRKFVREGTSQSDSDSSKSSGEGKRQRRLRIEHKYVDFFNLVLGTSGESRDFWTGVIRDSVKGKFDYNISDMAIDVLPRHQLLEMVQYHCGVDISDDVDFASESPFERRHFNRGIVRMKSPSVLSGAKLVEDDEWKTVSERSPLDGVRATEAKLRRFNAVSTGVEDLLENVLDSASLLSQHSQSLLANGSVDEAISSAERALDIGGLTRHPRKCFEASIALISAYMAKKDEDKAKEGYLAALSILERHLGENHPMLIALHSHIAGCYAGAKKYNEASAYHLKALDVAASSLGMRHPLVANANMVAGRLFLQLQDTEKALKHFEQAMVAFDSVDVRWAKNLLMKEVYPNAVREYAEALMGAGKATLAVSNARKALDLLLKKEEEQGNTEAGDYSYSTLSASRLVAEVLSKNNDLDVALKQWKEVIGLMKSSRDAESRDTWWYDEEKKSISALFLAIREYLTLRFKKLLVDGSSLNEIEKWSPEGSDSSEKSEGERELVDRIISELFVSDVDISEYFDEALAGFKKDDEKRRKMQVLYRISEEESLLSQ